MEEKRMLELADRLVELKESKAATEAQLSAINGDIEAVQEQLPAGERISRMYRAYEGDTRVITRDKSGKETRYTVKWNPQDDSVTIERM